MNKSLATVFSVLSGLCFAGGIMILSRERSC